MRRFIAGVFWGRFPRLYSTLDHPIRVPVQVAAYELGTRKYIQPGDTVLDIGFGLGYGLEIMRRRAGALQGIEIDRRAVSRGQELVRENSEILELKHYDGRNVPYESNSFDVVTCIDVIEHVPEYVRLLKEMVRVSRRVVLVSTPNRRPENTRPDGRPTNRWHLREWSYEELDVILQQMPAVWVDWNFLDRVARGRFMCRSQVSDHTMALTPALVLVS